MRGQLAERAAGVFEIFAKAAGTDVKGLQALMKEGKVGSDIVLKAGVMMGEWADKQGTLAVALQQSAAKQEQFNNKLKEMSLLILKSGLDQALAAMFSTLVPIVEVVGQSLSYIFKVLKSIYRVIKSITDYMKENDLSAAFLAVKLAVLALTLAVVRFGIINSAVMAQSLLATIRLNAALWITRLRLLGIIGVFTYLLTQLDGFFVRGEEDNIFMTWYYTVQMLASELDLMFAKIQYNWFKLKQNPFETMFGVSGDNTDGGLLQQIPVISPTSRWLADKINPVGEWIRREGFGIGRDIISPAQAVQQNAPTPVSQNITVNIDTSKASPQVQSSIVNGNMDLFSKMVGTEVNNQMRLSPHR